MRTAPALVLLAVTALPMLEAAPAAAADLSVETGRRVAVRHRERAMLVRDYDGTPVLLRKRAMTVRGPDGSLQTVVQSEAVPVPTAQPRTWIGGAPVMPN